MRMLKLSLLTISALLLAARAAPAADFLVKPGAPNKVVFISTATMEKFEGKTNRMEGKIAVQPGPLGDSVTVHLEVDLASLDTGIAKRNQHMREDHLETAKYPKAVFDGATVSHGSGVSLVSGQPTAFEADGTFTLHGVSRRLHVHIDATYQAGAGGAGTIEFHTQFPVTLEDYKITRPEFLFLKLAQTQDVHVNGVASATP
jgi:polyisoprenoid-binding protein YceI